MMKELIVALQACVLTGCTFAQPVSKHPDRTPPCPQTLRIGYPDFEVRPLLYGQGSSFGESPGLAVEWVQGALQVLGCRSDRVRLPLRRLLAELVSGELDVAVGLAFNAEREGVAAFPMRPEGGPDARFAIAETRASLYALTSRVHEIHWNGQTLQPAPTRVGVVEGAVEEHIAASRGWAIETAPHYTSNLAKLRSKRMLVTLLSSLMAEQADRKGEFTELSPPVDRTLFFTPVSIALKAKHGPWVRSFWLKVCDASRVTKKSPPSCE
jgi:hypothetical protein